MAKSIDSKTVVYEIKATNPNAIANFDTGKLVKAIGDDLAKFVGKPMQGLVVKGNDAKALVEKVKKDLVAKKCEQPWLRAGMSGSDMIFLINDLKNSKYEQSCMLVAGYKSIREKLKAQAAMVVNLDKGDKVIDRAAKDMAKATGTKAVTGSRAKFAGITGTTPIILLAHGDEDKTASGQIYGRDFADKSPKELVALLLDNKNEAKRLSPDYAGTIYLDGCFTAQGGAMDNYTKQVWDLLKGRGLKSVKVKGNLGAAATLKSGDELVTTTEAEEKAEKLVKKAQKDYEKKVEPFEKKLQEILAKKYGGKKTPAFESDDTVKKLKAATEKILKDAQKALQSDVKKIPGYEVKNLVGQFGLERLN